MSVRSEETVAMTIRGLPRRGALAGAFAAAGGTIADLTILLVLGSIVRTHPRFFTSAGGIGTWLGLAAGTTLVILGWRLMDDRTGGALSRERGGVIYRAYHANPVLDRLIGALLSPWRQVFWWTAGLYLVAAAARAGPEGITALAGGFALAAVAWPTFVAARLKDLKRERALSDRQYRVVTSLGGLALAATGLWTGAAAVAGSRVRGLLERIASGAFG
ncbi:MAG: hypothetical protein ACYTDY_08580 [Planctomycetota bacterium]|jgi:hypothetical protein